MSKRKKRKQTPPEQSQKFSRRSFFWDLFKNLLANALWVLIFESPLKRLIAFLWDDAPVPKVVTIEPTTIGLTSHTGPARIRARIR